MSTRNLRIAALAAFLLYVLVAVSIPAGSEALAVKWSVLVAALVLALAWAWSALRDRRRS